MTLRGRSEQYCTYLKWFHFRCSLLSFSRFNALGSSHSWCFPPCCISGSCGDPTSTNTVTSSSDFSYVYTSTVLVGPSSPLLLMQHPHPSFTFKPLFPLLPISYILPQYPHHRLMLQTGYLYLLLSLPPDSLRFLKSKAGDLGARSTELLHFILSHPVDLICMQESNLSSSSSFRIPRFSALRSDRTHSRPGIFSSDTMHASNGVVIFIRQGLSFSELSTSTLFCLTPTLIM